MTEPADFGQSPLLAPLPVGRVTAKEPHTDPFDAHYPQPAIRPKEPDKRPLCLLALPTFCAPTMAKEIDSTMLKDTNPKDAVGDKKVPLWLLSPIAKALWAEAQFVGQVKYGSWNWRVAGVRASTYLSAMDRHRDGYISGEEVDPTDGTDHLGNIMACCAILIDARNSGKLTDDRPPSINLRATYARVEANMVSTKIRYSGLLPTHYTIADTGK